MSYLTVLDKELLESLVRIQPLKAEGESARPIAMSYCTHDCRDVCEGGCADSCAMGCANNCNYNCGGNF